MFPVNKRQNGHVAAIALSDLHMQAKPPRARDVPGVDWIAVQAGYLDQLVAIARECGQPPILYAGDVCDWHDQPAELVNMLLEHLPPGYAVPGQHDLKNHSWKNLKKSTFWTLVRAGRLALLEPGKPVAVEAVNLHGFPFGFPVEHCGPRGLALEVAVVHAYIWKEGAQFRGATGESHADRFAERLEGYDVAVFGDNHSPFVHRANGTTIVNCGSFVRRRSDEVDHRPSVWVIQAGGRVLRRELDVSGDVFASGAAQKKGRETDFDFSVFRDELDKSADAKLDFREAVAAELRAASVGERATAAVWRALGKV